MDYKKFSVVCDILNSTYDTNILNTLNKKIQDKFNEVATKYKDTNIGNTTLMNLIYNHYNKEKPKVDMITGPFTLTVHKSDIHNKYIYVFGEIHGKENGCKCKIEQKCPTITEYLLKLFETTDVFIDFYLEIDSDNYIFDFGNKYYLDELRNKMQNCIRPITRKEKKECRLTRMHHVDVRRLSRATDGIEYCKLFCKGEFDTKTIVPQKDIKKIVEIFHKLSLSKKDFVDYCLSNMVINKNTQSYLKDNIYKFIEKKIISHIDAYNYKNIRKYILNIIKILSTGEEFTPIIISEIRILGSLFFYISVYIMDYYTLSRIFREFKISDKQYQPIKPTNIIIYVGDLHAELYREFFTTLNFKVIDKRQELEKDEPRCLNMVDIKQPFFTIKF